MALAPTVFPSARPVGCDRELVEAHRRGDDEGFTEIVRLHYPTLLASARRRLGLTGDAEDAVQETLLRAFRGLDRFGAEGDWRLGAWLERILANVCADLGSRNQRRSLLHDRLAAAGEPVERDVADAVADPVALAAVRRALDELPVTQRRAFELRVVEDRPYPEVAATLGITEDNARARVARARSALRQALSAAGTLVMAPVAALAARSRRHPGQWLRPASHTAGRFRVAVSGHTSALSGRGHLASAAGQLAAGQLGAPAAVSSSAGSVAASASAGSGALSSGLQLVAQLAASPVGQAALSLSTTPGKGTVVLGLAASLATAGALALPISHPSPPPPVVRRPASTGPVSAAEGAGATSANLQATPTAPPAPTEASAASAAGSDTTGGSSDAASAAPATPAWVAEAASILFGLGGPIGFDRSTVATTPTGSGTSGSPSGGTGSTPSTSAGSASTAPTQSPSTSSAAATSGSTGAGTSPSSTPSSTSTGSASSPDSAGANGSASPSASGTARTTTASPSGGSAPTSGTASSTAPAAATTSGSSAAPVGSAGTAATCTSVPGFPAPASTTPPAALQSVAIVDMLATGPAPGTSAAGSTPGTTSQAFHTSGTIAAQPTDPGVPVAVSVGTCVGSSDGLLAIKLTGSGGNEVELSGSLVAAPTTTAMGGGAPVDGQPTETTYLFRGTAQQIGGVFQEDSLPWGLPKTFVAELQVDQPAGTDTLTIAFVVPASTTSSSSSAAATLAS